MKIAFLGLGKAGGVFAREMAQSGADIFGYDPKCSSVCPNGLTQELQRAGIHVVQEPAAAVDRACLVISLTNEPQAENAAAGVQAYLQPHQLYLDLNLVSPMTKSRIRQTLSNADVVDGVIMKASVSTLGAQTPIYVAGPRGEEVSGLLNQLGLNVSFVSGVFGGACALKLLRSIFMKSIEVSLMESAHAAACMGIQNSFLDELKNTFHHDRYMEHLMLDMITTCPNHARRHGEEMQESVAFLEQLGIDNTMSRAIQSKFLYYANLDVDRMLGGIIPNKTDDVLLKLPQVK